jgi:hypothetical protein
VLVWGNTKNQHSRNLMDSCMLYLRSINRFILISLMLLGLSVSNQAQSAILSVLDVTPSATSVGVGESFSIDVGVSGITDPGAALVAYGISIAYDTSMFSLDLVTIFDELSHLGATTSLVTLSAFDVFVEEDSLQFDAAMAPFQPEAFTLFSLDFTALALGAGTFGGPPAFIAFGGLGAESPTITSFDVSVGAVPVPAAIWLFGTALIGMFGFGKRKSKVAV